MDQDNTVTAAAETADAEQPAEEVVAEAAAETEESPEVTTPEDETPAAEPEPEPETPVAVAADEAPAPEATETPAAPAVESTPEVAQTSDQPEAIAADGSGEQQEEASVDIPDEREPQITAPVYTTTITAGADIPQVPAGSEFHNPREIAEAFENRIESIRNARLGSGEKHYIATITASAPEERTLIPGDYEGNTRKVEAVTSEEALVASGGWCAPFETRYDIFGTGVTDRPVKAALPGFQARRGGIRFMAGPKIADYSGAIGLWTAANDEDPADDGGTPAEIIPKPVLKVTCPSETTVALDAVTLQLEFGNLMTRAYPELIERHNQLAMVAWARYAENNLLTKITALSTALTSPHVLGAARDWMVAVSRLAAAYRWRYRMNDTQGLRVLAPGWVRDMVQADLTYQLPGDDTLSVSRNEITSYLAARNVTVSWHLDGSAWSAEVGGTAVDDFPATFDWYMYAEGALLFLDGGTLDLGIVRDADLVGTNDYRQFMESFENVAKVGADVFKVTTTTHVRGGTSAAIAVS